MVIKSDREREAACKLCTTVVPKEKQALFLSVRTFEEDEEGEDPLEK